MLYIAVSLVLTGVFAYKTYIDDAAPVASALAAVGQPWAHMLVTSRRPGRHDFGPSGVPARAAAHLLWRWHETDCCRRSSPPCTRSTALPVFPTVLTGVLVAIAAMFVDISAAAELTNIGTLAAFIIVCAGVTVLRRTSPDQPRPFKCPWGAGGAHTGHSQLRCAYAQPSDYYMGSLLHLDGDWYHHLLHVRIQKKRVTTCDGRHDLRDSRPGGVEIQHQVTM